MKNSKKFGSGLLYDQLVMTSFLVMTNDHFFGHVKNKTGHAKKKSGHAEKKIGHAKINSEEDKNV
jgi:hypothetical protein